MSAHTPGPWEWFHKNWLLPVGGGTAILTYTAADDGLHGTDADKALIVAAPEMLDALKGAEEWLSGWASAEPYLSLIRAAIAKATGAA